MAFLSTAFGELLLTSYFAAEATFTLCIASTKLRTTATIASGSFSLCTAEPTPTPAAPAASAIGAVTLEIPDAQSTGTETACEIA